MSDLLCVSATTEEAAHLPEDSNVLVTGVGTLNAAIALGQRLVNLGTAGAVVDGRGARELAQAISELEGQLR